MVWQLAASAAIAMAAAVLAGIHGFLSAVLGGGIGVVGVLVFALMSAKRNVSPGHAVRIALRAEAAKIAVIVLLLWLTFAAYRELVVVAFIGSFMVSVLLSGIAYAVTDD